MQSPHHLVLVKPRDFAFNPQTAVSNAFQQPKAISHAQQLVQQEFDGLVQCLDLHGIAYSVFDPPAGVQVPDAVFPNNWFAVLPGGHLVIFPMQAPNRRDEINPLLITELKKIFRIHRITDLSQKADGNVFLEGTGSIVFDHDARISYACESPRTDIGLLEALCREIGYTPVSFLSLDLQGRPVYHTNVMMSVGARAVIICLESVSDAVERSILRQKILETGKNLVDISYGQMQSFCGNVLQVQDQKGKLFWLMSSTAYGAFTEDQRQVLSQSGEILHVAIPTIETLGGGSLRCMLAGIHTPYQA